MKILSTTLCLVALLWLGCDTTSTSISEHPVSVKWELHENDKDSTGQYFAEFTLTNQQSQPLTDKGWAIYYNQINSGAKAETVTGNVNIEVLSGTFVKLSPDANFETLEQGNSVVISYENSGYVTKVGDAPQGVYIVFDGKEPMLVDYEIVPFTKASQIKRTVYDNYPIPDAEYLYNENQRIEELPYEQVSPIVPTPFKVVANREEFKISGSSTIAYEAGLAQEATHLSEMLADVIGKKLTIKEGSEGDISLKKDNVVVNGKASEAYQLKCATSGITITGSDNAGVFYGIQSLIALIEPSDWGSKKGTITIGGIEVEDAPHFSYRGLMLDVSRNFQKKESVLKLLDLMSFYKLNKLHFHLTDDEGWRLEIPGIPELTEVGSKRGHTEDEKDRIYPAYGSGPFTNSWGSGHYTKSDFVEILAHAKNLHIEVIPEIDLPGHARAAIKSMEVRYEKLMESGNEAYAKEYLLNDPNDKSEYVSVQNYDDNVICVCQESTYTFLEKVTDELMAMYEEAGLNLKVLHTGGDEVPSGVWSASPICDELAKEQPQYKGEGGLSNYFITRFSKILDERGVVTGGWEEVGLTRIELENHQHTYEVNPQFADANFQPYVWNAVFGWGGEDRGYKLANAGYNIVMCNASNLYFDLAYDKDPREGGLYWAGYVDTRKAYEFIPYDLFKSADLGRLGEKLKPEDLAVGKTALTEKGKENILGIQGHLWSETVLGGERMEYYIFPKILGLSERAWTAPPTWTSIPDTDQRRADLDVAWNGFSNTLGQREMPRLNHLHGGVNYRIPKPGAIIRDGKLSVNMAYPGFEIRYTIDGSEPTKDSPIVEDGMEVKGEVNIRAFDARGRGSLTTKAGSKVLK